MCVLHNGVKIIVQIHHPPIALAMTNTKIITIDHRRQTVSTLVTTAKVKIHTTVHRHQQITVNHALHPVKIIMKKITIQERVHATVDLIHQIVTYLIQKTIEIAVIHENTQTITNEIIQKTK